MWIMHQNAAQIGNSYLLNLQSSCWSLVSGAASWKSIMMFNILWFQAPMSFCCFFNHSVGWWVVWESEVTILPAHPDVSHVSHNHSTSADTGDEKIGFDFWAATLRKIIQLGSQIFHERNPTYLTCTLKMPPANLQIVIFIMGQEFYS